VLAAFGPADVEAERLCHLAFFGQQQTTKTFGRQLLLFRECTLQVITRLAAAVGSSIALFGYNLIARRRYCIQFGNHNDTILGIMSKWDADCVVWCNCCVRSVEAKSFVFTSSLLFRMSFRSDMMKGALWSAKHFNLRLFFLNHQLIRLQNHKS
jgi:hypothetical protein